MRRFVILISLLSLLCISTRLFGQATVTPNIGLEIPAYQQSNWQVPLNYDLSQLDLFLSGNIPIPGKGPLCYGASSCNPSSVNDIVYVDGATYTTIAAAQAALPSSKGMVWVTASSPAQTISSTLTWTAQGLHIDPGVTVTIATGGQLTFGQVSALDAPGAIINVTKTSGDAIVVNGGLAQLRLAVLSYGGSGGTTNGLVFVNNASGNQANIGQITSFPGNNVQFARSGAGGALNNTVWTQSNLLGGIGVLFSSGVSGTDTVTFDEGNRYYGSLISQFTTQGIKFGDGGTLGDAKYNYAYTDVHDTSVGGLTDVSFTDDYNSFEGTTFSQNGTSNFVTFASSAVGNFLRTHGVGANLFGGSGLNAQNIVTTAVQVASISSGFGTSPSIVNTACGETCRFEVNVGTGGSATSGVIGLPTAPNGWACQANDMNTNIVTRETAFSTFTATFTAASAWTASDKLLVNCAPF